MTCTSNSEQPPHAALRNDAILHPTATDHVMRCTRAEPTIHGILYSIQAHIPAAGSPDHIRPPVATNREGSEGLQLAGPPYYSIACARGYGVSRGVDAAAALGRQHQLQSYVHVVQHRNAVPMYQRWDICRAGTGRARHGDGDGNSSSGLAIKGGTQEHGDWLALYVCRGKELRQDNHDSACYDCPSREAQAQYAQHATRELWIRVLSECVS